MSTDVSAGLKKAQIESNKWEKSKYFERKPSKTILTSSTKKSFNHSDFHLPSFHSPPSKIIKNQIFQTTRKEMEKKQKESHPDQRTPKRNKICSKQSKQGKQGKEDKKDNSDPSQFYKYWKQKAHQYQEQNFCLTKENTLLKEQYEMMRHKMEKLQKECQVYRQRGLMERSTESGKVEDYLKENLLREKEIREEQKKKIQKYEKSIRQFSKCAYENKALKQILENLEVKVNQITSNPSSLSSQQQHWSSPQKNIVSFKKERKSQVQILKNQSYSNEFWGIVDMAKNTF